MMPLTSERDNKTQHRRHAAKQNPGRGSWFELLLFFLMAAGIYTIATLLDSSWTGDSGRRIGGYLRSVWGGALLVPLLFWLYLCVAWLVRFRVPRPLGQILGTFQLYLSIAFMLGLFRKVGWNPGWTLSEPGRIGDGLADFFVLNLGVLGTVLVSFASLFLAGMFFGLRFPAFLTALFASRLQEGARPDARSAVEGRVEEPKVDARPQEGDRGPRLVRHASPGGLPFDPLKPTGTVIVFDPEEPRPEAEPDVEEPEAPVFEEHRDGEPFVNEGKLVFAPMEVEEEVAFSGEPPRDSDHPCHPDEGEQGKLPGDEEKVSLEQTGETPVAESSEPPQTAVEILDHLLASLEAGEYDVPPPPQQETPVERVSTNRRPPVADLPGAASGEEPEPSPKTAAAEGEPAGLRHGAWRAEGRVVEVNSTPKIGAEERMREIRDRLVSPAPERSTVEDRANSDGRDSAVQEVFPDVNLPDEEEAKRFRAGAFPPPLDILGPAVRDEDREDARELADSQAEIIVDTLQNFGVKATVAHIVVGPSVIQFQIELAPGIKVSKVAGLANDLTMALAVVSVRVEAPILGQRYVGIEIPNPRRKGIALRSAMESEEFQKGDFLLPLPMGMRVDSRYLVCGLEDMPHLLVAGTTGSGKSVFVNSCILGMCSRRSPDALRLILVDPKHVEFAIYEGLPHLLARPVSDPRKAISALSWAVQEMERRTECFARARVRNLASYNEKVLPKDRFPNIVVVVDELADLMYTAGKEVEGLIARLAQKARAAGIHLILATQRPSVDVITGLIKANVPARVAFAVPSQTDSRTIIDTGGADKLLGKGDMLFFSTRYPRPLRLQAPFITEERTLDFVEYMKGAFGEPEYIEFEDAGNPTGEGNGRNGSSIVDDPKMEEAIRVVMDTGIASASGLQRYLNIGYPRAGRIITGLEQLGIVGSQPANSSKSRDILMDEDGAFEALEHARTGGLFGE